MKELFDIRWSEKNQINSPEHFIVTRGDVVFLRVLGKQPLYEIMTATAGENTGKLHAFEDQKKLMIVAVKATLKIFKMPEPKTKIKPLKDTYGRDYIKLFRVEYISDAYRFAETFFEILDECTESSESPNDDMKKIYSDFAVDESGDDVYLSDGVWLSSDGQLKDEGR